MYRSKRVCSAVTTGMPSRSISVRHMPSRSWMSMAMLVKGALCNALVCLAVWLSFAARTATDKILARSVVARNVSATAWLEPEVQALGAARVEAFQRAQGLAALIVAAYEGGLLQSRVAHSAEPMQRATDTLLALLPPSPTPENPS